MQCANLLLLPASQEDLHRCKYRFLRTSACWEGSMLVLLAHANSNCCRYLRKLLAFSVITKSVLAIVRSVIFLKKSHTNWMRITQNKCGFFFFFYIRKENKIGQNYFWDQRCKYPRQSKYRVIEKDCTLFQKIIISYHVTENNYTPSWGRE